jgi:hypothetical protein
MTPTSTTLVPMPKLLRLGKVKNLYLDQNLPKTDFMEDMISQMKLVAGADKTLGWGNEITAWRLELAADKLQRDFNDTAVVGHFEKKLCSIKASAERAKDHAKKRRRQVFEECLPGHQLPWIPGGCRCTRSVRSTQPSPSHHLSCVRQL